MKRALQREILNPLALRILDRTFKEGDTVVVDFTGDRITFGREVIAEVEA